MAVGCKWTPDSGNSGVDLVPAETNAYSDGDAAPSASIRITTNTIQPEEVPPIPFGFEFLYVTGEDTPSTVNSLRVDGEMLFWGQQVLLWRAPKDGSGEPVCFGNWVTTQGSALLSDETYLYWHDGPELKRKRKDSVKVSESPARARHNFPWGPEGFVSTYREEIEVLDLGVDYSYAVLDLDATHLYLAPFACTPVHKIDLATFQVEAVFEFERPATNGGESSLRLDEHDIYCKNREHLFRMAKDGSSPAILTDSLQRRGTLTVPDPNETSDPLVYLLDFEAAGRNLHVRALSATEELTDFGESPKVGATSSRASPLEYDSRRQLLSWLGYGGGGEGFWLTSLDLATREYVPTRPLFMTDAFTADEDHFYWAGHLQHGNLITTILRLHKDRMADVARDCTAVEEGIPTQ